MNEPIYITRMLKDAIAGMDDVLDFMTKDEMDFTEFWQFNGYSKIKSVRSRLYPLISTPELLFSISERDSISELVGLTQELLIHAPWVEEESAILGSLATVEEVLRYLSMQCDFGDKQQMIHNSEKELLVVPAQKTLSELIMRLGPDPRDWYSLGSRRFEELLAEIWSGLGWETVLTPPSNDGGFDIRAIRNTTGVTACYLIEAKAYDPCHPVGVEVVRHLYGVVERERATHGILATTSRFTKGAIAESQALRYRLSLADFSQVRKWASLYLGIKNGSRSHSY